MKRLVAVLAALPLAAFAQGSGPQGGGPGGRGMGPGNGRDMPERVEKRARLARTLGLAEALDLDAPQALKLGESIARFDERRLAAHRQLFDAHQALRKAAAGEKASAAEVDQAIQKVLDARAQVQAIDREMIAAVTKDLSPEKKARAVLFLESFQRRFGPRHLAARMGPGMMQGMMQGPGARLRKGPPPGLDPRMDGPCPGPGCDWDLDDE